VKRRLARSAKGGSSHSVDAVSERGGAERSPSEVALADVGDFNMRPQSDLVNHLLLERFKACHSTASA